MSKSAGANNGHWRVFRIARHWFIVPLLSGCVRALLGPGAPPWPGAQVISGCQQDSTSIDVHACTAHRVHAYTFTNLHRGSQVPGASPMTRSACTSTHIYMIYNVPCMYTYRIYIYIYDQERRYEYDTWLTTFLHVFVLRGTMDGLLYMRYGYAMGMLWAWICTCAMGMAGCQDCGCGFISRLQHSMCRWPCIHTQPKPHMQVVGCPWRKQLR